MYSLAKVLTILAAVAFLMAVFTTFTGPFMGTPAEGYSRACSNLALLALALVLVFEPRGRAGALP